MIPLIEYLLLALTDAQFDKILVMINEAFSTMSAGIQVIWNMASPLLIGLVALQLARYQAAAQAARKAIVEKIDKETVTSQADRTKIIEDLTENTTINKAALESANNFHIKADKLKEQIEQIKP
jgi:hypothetical protein